MAEFHILASDSVICHGADIVVTGRVNEGVIRCGTVFFRAIPSATSFDVPAMDGYEVHLTVSKIVAYRRELEEIEKGMPCELYLPGRMLESRESDVILPATD